MTWYHEIAYAEPTLLGTIGAGMCHMLLFLTVTSWEFGLAKHIDACLSKRYTRLYNDVIRKNYESKDELDVWGMDTAPEKLWISCICTFLHHSTAGLLMYVGMVTDSPWIWRHGLLTQLFGSDLLDFARMAWCLLLPPGPWPTSHAIKSAKYRVFIGLHHSTSLLAGLPASMYFAGRPEFQFMGILLAGYPMMGMGLDILSKLVHPRYHVLHAAAELAGTLGFIYQRVVMYFPIALSLLQTVYASGVPLIAKVSLALGGLMMSLFNLMFLPMAFQSVKKHVVKFTSGTEAKAAADVVSTEEVGKQAVTKSIEEEHNGPTEELPTLLRKRHQHVAPACLKSPFGANVRKDAVPSGHSDSDTTRAAEFSRN